MYLRHWPFIYAATCDFLRLDGARQSGAELLFNEWPVAEIHRVDVAVCEYSLGSPAGAVGVAYEVPPHDEHLDQTEKMISKFQYAERQQHLVKKVYIDAFELVGNETIDVRPNRST